MSQFFESTLSNQYCGFHKSLSVQKCLLVWLENWKRYGDRGKAFGCLLANLSKAFYCLDHDLLIAKLNASGHGLPALRFSHDYLPNMKQRMKVNCSNSEWLEWLVFRVWKGSILVPLLFNICLANLFPDNLYLL